VIEEKERKSILRCLDKYNDNGWYRTEIPSFAMIKSIHRRTITVIGKAERKNTTVYIF
jgi:hypothetical protein